MKELRVAIFQGSPKLFEKEKNAEKAICFISSVDADLYVFGELFLTGYSLKNEVRAIAEDPERPSEPLSRIVEEVRKKGSWAVIGAPEMGKEGKIYNSAFILGPRGIEGIYRKRKLPNFGPFREYMYFSPGNSPFTFKIGEWKIGVEICYDIFFPEISAEYCREALDILITISASPVTSRKLFETMIPARAIENGAYHIYVNLAGCEEDLLFWGGSRICSPKGEVLASCKYFREDQKVLEIERDKSLIMKQFRPISRDYWMGILR